MDLHGKKLLLIGGAGLIGSHVADELVKTDAGEIIIFDNFSRGSAGNLKQALKDPRVKIFSGQADIQHTDILAQAMEGVDGVFHLAAYWLLQCHAYPVSAFEVNVRGTFNVIMAALKAGVIRLVYSSSASVYGDARDVPMDENHAYDNTTFYGATKIAGEHFLKTLAHGTGLTWAGLRYMNVYGPRQDYKGAYIAVMHRMLDRLDRGLSPQITGDGTQMYDFVHVADIARANVLAMGAESTGECYNIGRGIGTSINELAALLTRLSGREIEPEYLPGGQAFVTHRVGSTEKAERDLGYKWTIGLEEGMESLIRWRREDQDGLGDVRRAAGV